MSRITSLGGAVLVSLGFVGAANANLILNGSFEDPGSVFGTTVTFLNSDARLLSVSDSGIPSWTVVTNEVAWLRTPAYSLGAQEGSYFMDLGGIEQSDPGGMETSFATTIGGVYNVSFWIGSDSVYNGIPTGGSVAPTIEAFINTSSFGSFSGSNSSTNVWEQFSFSFTATGALTTLTLAGGPAGNTSTLRYVGLDNVEVTSVPDGGLTLILLGFGLTGLAILRRKLT